MNFRANTKRLHPVYLALLLILAVLVPAVADTITYSYTFTAGTVAQPGEVNSNFSAVSTVVNGNIDNNNIKSAANITRTKLNTTSEDTISRSTTNRCFSAATTGDTVPRGSLYADGWLGMGAGGASAQDMILKRKSSSFFQITDLAGTTDKSLEAASFDAFTNGDANAKAQLSTTGLKVGPGGASALDFLWKRIASGFAARDAGDSADAAITCSAITGSGNWLTTGTIDGSNTGILNGGRLTTESGVGVSTSDRTAQGTIYWTPYYHGRISLNDGTRYVTITPGEKSLALTVSSGSNYDVWGVLSGGTLALSLSSAWTNDTTRGFTVNADTNGVLSLSTDRTKRYLGTIRGSGSNVTADSASQRYVFNADNRVDRPMRCRDDTNSWTYATSDYRATNGNTTLGVGRVDFVIGLADRMVTAQSTGICTGSAGGVNGTTGIGLDSTTTDSAYTRSYGSNQAGALGSLVSHYNGVPGVGYHYLQNLEWVAGATTVTFYGDNGDSEGLQSGMTAEIWN